MYSGRSLDNSTFLYPTRPIAGICDDKKFFVECNNELQAGECLISPSNEKKPKRYNVLSQARFLVSVEFYRLKNKTKSYLYRDVLGLREQIRKARVFLPYA